MSHQFWNPVHDQTPWTSTEPSFFQIRNNKWLSPKRKNSNRRNLCYRNRKIQTNDSFAVQDSVWTPEKATWIYGTEDVCDLGNWGSVLMHLRIFLWSCRPWLFAKDLWAMRCQCFRENGLSLRAKYCIFRLESKPDTNFPLKLLLLWNIDIIER